MAQWLRVYTALVDDFFRKVYSIYTYIKYIYLKLMWTILTLSERLFPIKYTALCFNTGRVLSHQLHSQDMGHSSLS